MLKNKLLERIDKDFDNFKQDAQEFNCQKPPCSCKKKDPVKKYICYKMYRS